MRKINLKKFIRLSFHQLVKLKRPSRYIPSPFQVYGQLGKELFNYIVTSV